MLMPFSRPLLSSVLLVCLSLPTLAGTLTRTPAGPACTSTTPLSAPPPAAAALRLPQSQAVAGQRDIGWVWLGTPTARYPHTALGSPRHAGSLHVLPAAAASDAIPLSLTLSMDSVFEDRVPRLVDLDGDGRDEILLIEAVALRGAALVVYGLRDGALVELARGPYAGSTFRWLNPVGVADFDGDGRLDIASVTTPHIGGVLTLHHYRPPRLEPYARTTDVSNHRMGELEQRLAVIVSLPDQRPTLLIPDMQLQTLQALRWDVPGQWHEAAPPLSLPARVQRFTPLGDGGCLQLIDGSSWRVTLRP